MRKDTCFFKKPDYEAFNNIIDHSELTEHVQTKLSRQAIVKQVTLNQMPSLNNSNLMTEYIFQN